MLIINPGYRNILCSCFAIFEKGPPKCLRPSECVPCWLEKRFDWTVWFVDADQSVFERAFDKATQPVTGQASKLEKRPQIIISTNKIPLIGEPTQSTHAKRK